MIVKQLNITSFTFILFLLMLRSIGSINRLNKILNGRPVAFFGAKKIKIIDNPSDSSKLVFNEQGLCKIYEYKMGEHTLRKIVRYVTGLTFLNGIMFGLEQTLPSISLLIIVFGNINMISFGLVTGLGYMMLSFIQVYSRRIVHRMYIEDDFETIHIEFFNAFWVVIHLSRNQRHSSSILLNFKSQFQVLRTI